MAMETTTEADIEAIFDEISADIFSDGGSTVDAPSNLNDQHEAYTYSSLTNPKRDIRLVELFPGKVNYPVEIRIFQEPLVEPSTAESPGLTLRELAKTLPPGWKVIKTIQERYIFVKIDKNGQFSAPPTWTHPAHPVFNPRNYEMPPVSKVPSPSPRFEALSYVWRSGNMTDAIAVRVPEGRKMLQVTANLQAALAHLRDENLPRTLWIDAICLNQEDKSEKDQQIPRMRDIYRLAHRVVVWMGPETESTLRAISFINRIAKRVEVSDDGSMLMRSPDATESFCEEILSVTSFDDLDFQACEDLLNVPWAYRLWIVQEVRLARSRPGAIMQWGLQTAEVCNVHRAVAYFRHRIPHRIPQRLSDAATAIAMTLGPSMRISRQILTRHISSRLCSNPHDRVYGLLGLTSQDFARHTQISYDKDIVDVNRDAFLLHTRLTNRLDLLPDRDFCLRQMTHATSWVPIFNHAGNEFRRNFAPQFSANNTRAHIAYSQERPGRLGVLGISCAVVDKTSAPLLSNGVANGRSEAINLIRTWQPDDLDTAKYMSTEDSKRTAFARTLLQDEVFERRPQHLSTCPPLRIWENQHNDLVSYLFIPRRHDGEEGSFTSFWASKRASDMMNQEALSRSEGRLFFQTKDGHMGIAPSDAQRDDVIAIFLGYPNPVVLRPCVEPDRFLFVGECFVHGLQDSTKLLGPLPAPWVGQFLDLIGGRISLRFKNTETEETTLEDPRLEPLGDEWERLTVDDEDMEQDDPLDVIRIRHRETGEIIKHDPRLEPDSLKARDVELSWFTLV